MTAGTSPVQALLPNDDPELVSLACDIIANVEQYSHARAWCASRSRFTYDRGEVYLGRRALSLIGTPALPETHHSVRTGRRRRRRPR